MNADGKCLYSSSGHMVHPIQMKLAYNAGRPRLMQILEEAENGFLVAPYVDNDSVEHWCMHERHRAVFRGALARGTSVFYGYEHGLAEITERISYTSPEHWTPCPEPGDLQPWETGFFEVRRP